MTSGPRERAGFKEPPVKGIPVRYLVSCVFLLFFFSFSANFVRLGGVGRLEGEVEIIRQRSGIGSGRGKKRKRAEYIYIYNYIPVSSAKKNANPIPNGAMKVALCFSTASISIVSTNWAVRNISMNSPCAIDVPLIRRVPTAREVGKMAEATPAAAMPPTSCAMMTSTARRGPMTPRSKSAKATCMCRYV